MGAFLVRRLLSLVVLLVGMSFVMFLLTSVLPGDPARVAAGPDASPEVVERFRQRLGLDRPLPEQYVRFLANLARGDLGASIRSKQPVLDELRAAAPATIELTIAATIVFVAVSIPLGVVAASRKHGWVDTTSRILAIGGTAIAPFWLAFLLQLIFFRFLGWLPAGARIAMSFSPPPRFSGLYLVDAAIAGDLALLLNAMRHLVLPVAALALGRIAITTRLTRAQMLMELGSDYVRTARGKGVNERKVLYHHALRNGLNPVITNIGIQVGYLLSGAVLVEAIFQWPGLGSYSLDAILNFDYPAVLGVALLISIFFALVNLLVDVSYAFLDPRVKVS